MVERPSERGFQHFVNVIAAETLPLPRLRWLFLKIFSNSKFGIATIPWPGARIYNSSFGDYCAIGMGSRTVSSTIGDGTVVAAKAEVINARVGKNCFIAANARVSGTIPDESFVYGTNLKRERIYERRPTNRNVIRIPVNGLPQWDWFPQVKYFGVFGMFNMLLQQMFTNTIAAACNNTPAKRKLSSMFCNVDRNCTIDHTAILDSMFSRNLWVKKGAVIEKDTLVLTHSLIDEAGYLIERGDTTIGSNSTLGEDSLVLPGVTIPDNVVIPAMSLVSSGGAYLVGENRKLAWDEMKK